MSKEELLTKALELLEKRKYSELRSELIDMEPIDIARLCDDLPEEKLPVVYRLLQGAGGGDLCRIRPRYSGAAYKILFR